VQAIVVAFGLDERTVPEGVQGRRVELVGFSGGGKDLNTAFTGVI
jgi:hypothetical protein